MLANFLIGLREGLEAGLVVSILMAYLARSGRSHLVPRVWAGIALAVGVSLAFGALLTYGPRGLTFEAQEAIGGTLSIVAVGFVTWMVFWMAHAARSLSGRLRDRVDVAAEGGWFSLALIAALAVGREGLETALFLWSASQAVAGGPGGTGSTWQPLLAALAGIVVAVALAYLLYRGAIRLDLTRFFTWTGAFLIVVAGGVLSYGVHDLQEAGILPGLNSYLFDVSAQVPAGSWYGVLLKGTVNFSPATTHLEALAWVAYVVPTMTLFLLAARRRRTAGRPAATTPVPTPS
ncbi:FTR1 family protein [Nocardioides lentus]|uniref:FTR1 family protein n=1 Tax=Nocardioides lentus TaxID=338077 RepID=A0ABP5AWK8_9ACTN